MNHRILFTSNLIVSRHEAVLKGTWNVRWEGATSSQLQRDFVVSAFRSYNNLTQLSLCRKSEIIVFSLYINRGHHNPCAIFYGSNRSEILLLISTIQWKLFRQPVQCKKRSTEHDSKACKCRRSWNLMRTPICPQVWVWSSHGVGGGGEGMRTHLPPIFVIKFSLVLSWDGWGPVCFRHGMRFLTLSKLESLALDVDCADKINHST